MARGFNSAPTLALCPLRLDHVYAGLWPKAQACKCFQTFRLLRSCGGSATVGKKNLTHSMVWRTRGQTLHDFTTLLLYEFPKGLEHLDAQNLINPYVSKLRGAKTLRAVWFGVTEAPKPYAQYGFETYRGGVLPCFRERLGLPMPAHYSENGRAAKRNKN